MRHRKRVILAPFYDVGIKTSGILCDMLPPYPLTPLFPHYPYPSCSSSPPLPRNEKNLQKHFPCPFFTSPQHVPQCVQTFMPYIVEYSILTYWCTILLVRGGEENRQWWRGKVLEYLHSIPGHQQIKTISTVLQLKLIEHFIELCCVLKTSSLLDYERKGLVESACFNLIVLLDRKIVLRRTLYVYFCGGGGSLGDRYRWYISQRRSIHFSGWTIRAYRFPYPNYDWTELQN